MTRSLARLERLVMIAAAIRRSYPETTAADVIGGAVVVADIDDRCGESIFTVEHMERAQRGECDCMHCATRSMPDVADTVVLSLFASRRRP